MVKLSPRLQLMVDGITKGETVADIGTDHGLLPIFLLENGISPQVILVDINEGPLEKARENMRRHIPEETPDLRLGSGIEPLACGEADTVIIAGMGGFLMIDILEADKEKTKSFRKYILQPRNAPEKLRGWLLRNGFSIADESLVRERQFLCEVITAVPVGDDGRSHISTEGVQRMEESLELEISPLLIKKGDPLLMDFIVNKIRIEEKIIGDILTGENRNTSQRTNSEKNQAEKENTVDENLRCLKENRAFRMKRIEAAEKRLYQLKKIQESVK